MATLLSKVTEEKKRQREALRVSVYEQLRMVLRQLLPAGTEIWVFDLKSHQRKARWPIDIRQTGAVAAVQVSQDPAPLLFLATEEAHLLILDAQTGKLKHDENHLGQTPQLLLNP